VKSEEILYLACGEMIMIRRRRRHHHFSLFSFHFLISLREIRSWRFRAKISQDDLAKAKLY
jgi:hypothetical protein